MASSREILNEIFNEENNVKEMAHSKIDTIETKLMSIEEANEKSIAKIDASFAFIVNLLGEWKNDFLEEVTKRNLALSSKLNSEKFLIEDSLNNLLTVISSAKRNLDSCPPNANTDEIVERHLLDLCPVLNKLIEERKEKIYPIMFNSPCAEEFLKSDDRFKIGYIESFPIAISSLSLVPKTMPTLGSQATFDIKGIGVKPWYELTAPADLLSSGQFKHQPHITSLTVRIASDLEVKDIQEFCLWSVTLDGVDINEVEMHLNSNFCIEFFVAKRGAYMVRFQVYHQHVVGSPYTFYATGSEVTDEKKGNGMDAITDDAATKNSKIPENLHALSSKLKLIRINKSMTPDKFLFQKPSGSTSSSNNDSSPSPPLKIDSPMDTGRRSVTGMDDESFARDPIWNKAKMALNLKPLRRPHSSSVSIDNYQQAQCSSVSTNEDKVFADEDFKPSFASTSSSKALTDNLQKLDISELNGSLDKSVAPGDKTLLLQKVLIKKEIVNKSPDATEMFEASFVKKEISPRTDIKMEMKSSSVCSSPPMVIDSKLVAKTEFIVMSTQNSVIMKYPIGVCQLSSKSIVVADTFNDRMLLFGPKGSFLHEFNSQLKLIQPSAIVELPDQTFAVKDNRGITIFSSQFKEIRIVGSMFLRKPYGLTDDGNGNLITVEYGSDGDILVLVINPKSGNLLSKSIIRRGLTFREAANSKPRFIYCKPPHTLHVVDLGLDVVMTIDLNKNMVVNVFGGRGKGIGQFRDPSGITCDSDGYIIVGDSRNHRIQIFTPNGEFMCVMEVDRPLKRPSGIHLSPKGELLVLNYWENSLVKYRLSLHN